MINVLFHDDEFWIFIKNNGVAPKTSLSDFYKNLIKNCKVNFNEISKLSGQNNISTPEMKNMLTSGYLRTAYNRISYVIPNLRLCINGEIFQSLSHLSTFDPQCLLSILENKNDPVFSCAAFSMVNISFSFFSIDKSSNISIRFCALTNIVEKIGEEEEKAYISKLKKSLIFALKDDAERLEWLYILNTYPSRFPFIQESLGLALAEMKDIKVITDYINSMYLYPHESKKNSNQKGIEAVAKCLDSFSKHSDEINQKKMWDIAYKRWEEWNFGINNNETYIFNICNSIIDYPVIMYFLEVLDINDNNKIKQKTLDEMHGIQNTWHSSRSSLLTYWFTRLSRLQFVYHTEEIRKAPLTPIISNRTYNLDFNTFQPYLDKFLFQH